MNGKKAKLLRKLEESQYKIEPEYMIAKTVMKKIHTVDKVGKPQLKEVERRVIINKSRLSYRRLKRSYKNGDFTI